MASIYKRASKAEAAELSDESTSSVGDETSNTVQDDNDEDSDVSSVDEDAATASKLSQMPTELRNRILMLTSRGVSFR